MPSWSSRLRQTRDELIWNSMQSAGAGSLQRELQEGCARGAGWGLCAGEDHPAVGGDAGYGWFQKELLPSHCCFPTNVAACTDSCHLSLFLPACCCRVTSGLGSWTLGCSAARKFLDRLGEN
ncbi:hypothetical protein DBR06_SOUSAS12410032, partial [Sousa chinensis]